MGTNNRQRRAAKRRQAQRKRGHGSGGPSRSWGFGAGAGPDDDVGPLPLGDVILAAASAAERGLPEMSVLLDDLVLRASRRPDAGAHDVSAALAGQMQTVVGECWELGWQPADLVHVVARRHKAVHREMCATVVAWDAERYREHPGADAGWMAQVEAVTDGVAVPASDELLGTWTARAGDLHTVFLVALETLGTLLSLPRQPVLCPPPSQWVSDEPHRDRGAGGSVHDEMSRRGGRAADPKVVERVRALLAKAESTDFPDEAEAFTAKAQELIARHAIDLAMLRGETRDGSGARAQAASRRVLIDDPYGRVKSLLVAVIARANRCTAVWDRELSVSTVFGSAHDLDAVELLYTSLLTQATAAMVHAGRAGAERRSRSFRSSFLMAYASRIGERLAEATASAVREAQVDHGDEVLPVLASQQAAAEEARDEAFPHLQRSGRITTRNVGGWLAGRAAADQARLGPDTALSSH